MSKTRGRRWLAGFLFATLGACGRGSADRAPAAPGSSVVSTPAAIACALRDWCTPGECREVVFTCANASGTCTRQRVTGCTELWDIGPPGINCGVDAGTDDVCISLEARAFPGGRACSGPAAGVFDRWMRGAIPKCP